MMSYLIRRAKLSDLEQLVKFIAAEGKEAEGISLDPEIIKIGIRTALENDSIAKYWVLENRKSEVIGNISVVKEWSDWRAGNYWWIQSIYILPDYRGMGLMSKLIETIRDQAYKEEALDVRLYVHKANVRAINAYTKAGFLPSDYNIMIMKL